MISKMLTVRDIDRNKLNSCINCLSDYRRGYICDVISEIADSHTSIYYSDIIKFISDNVEAVNDAIAEFGWDGCGSDLYKAGQMAEYCQLEREMYEELENGLFNFAMSYIEHDLEVEKISEDQLEQIENLCKDTDNNDQLETFIGNIEKIINADDED